MASWQERINAEINRRAMPAQKPIEMPKAVSTVPSREELWKIRIAKVDVAIQELEPEQRNVFGLLDRIGARHMLEGIRDEVWEGNGRIVPVGEIGKHGRIKRGLSLRFDYEHSMPRVEGFYDTSKHFGFHEVGHVQNVSSLQGSQYTTSYSERKFGSYESHHPYTIVNGSLERSGGTAIEIAIVKREEEIYAYRNLPYCKFFLADTFKLNARSLDEAEAKKRLEEFLLAECVNRQKNGDTPAVILRKIQQNRESIKRAIKEGRKFYYDKYGKEIPYWRVCNSVGLVDIDPNFVISSSY